MGKVVIKSLVPRHMQKNRDILKLGGKGKGVMGVKIDKRPRKG